MQFNMPTFSTKIDQLSFSSCYLDLIGEGDESRHATGFLWRHGTQVYLVTNWHVVTGINILNGSFMKHGWCPKQLVIHFISKSNPFAGTTIAGEQFTFDRGFDVGEASISLYEDFHNPFWIQHEATFDGSIDIAILPLDEKTIAGNPQIICVNDYKFESLFHSVGNDIFVIGHPLRSADTLYPVTLPVWKRGSIASELFIPWNMRPAFLIDVKTSGGMSGSPVIRRSFGPTIMADLSIADKMAVCSEFMGVYSGRLHDDDDNASIGLVWHRNLIDEIIANPSRGSREWRPSNLPSIFRPQEARD